MGEAKKIYVLWGQPSDLSAKLTLLSMFYTGRERAEEAIKFHKLEFPGWEWGIDTYSKEGE